MVTTVPPTDGPATVRFTILGPVRAWRGGTELDLGSRRQQRIVALLLAQTGQVVATDDIVELLWGPRPPAQAVNVVHRHIGALRRLLEPNLPARAAGQFLQRRHSGYLLQAPSDLIDFRRLADQARSSGGLPVYLEALRLWHGRCADGPDPAGERHPVFLAVDQERSLVAQEAADLALAPGGSRGAVRAVLAVLRPAAEQDPYDEALQARLILALAADGHPAEATGVYDRLRTRLADELGMDPGPALRDAYEAALRRPGAEMVAGRLPPAQIPATSRLFTGRRAELRALSDLLPLDDSPGTGVVTVSIDGIPGVGKSTLAVHWGRLVADRFPGGQLFVDLRGYDPGGAVVSTEEALGGFLGALGVDPRSVPAGVEAQAALYRTMTTGRRMLILVDNARDAEQVRPLIPGADGSMVVVTSRNQLTGLAAHDGAQLLSLNVPSLDDARAELHARLGEDRASADPVALDEIISSCGRLPLALAVVGARVAAHPTARLQDVAGELRSSGATLETFGGDEPGRDLRGVCDGSYRLLSRPAARLFRQLSLNPGPDIGLATVAALAGVGTRQAVRLTAELTHTRLLTEHRYRRYVFHELIRRYALELGATLDTAAERQCSLTRIVDHLRLTANAATRSVTPSLIPRTGRPAGPDSILEPVGEVPTAMAWFAAEAPVIEALVPVVGGAGAATRPWELAITLLAYYQRTGRYGSWSTTAQSALRIAEAARDTLGEAHMLRMLAGAEHFRGASELALAHLDRALTLFETLGLVEEQGFVLHNTGWVDYARGRPNDAAGRYEQALRIFSDTGNERGTAFSLLGLGYALNRLDRSAEALAGLGRATAIFERLGDENSVASCLDALANVHQSLGDYDRSIRFREQALRMAQSIGNLVNEIEFHTGLGETLRLAGRPADAAIALSTAIALADRAGMLVEAAEARGRLTLVHER